MIKLVANIIDKDCNLKGFVCRGKAKEFGAGGSEEVFRAVPLPALAKAQFKSNQIEVKSNGVVHEIGYFRIHDLPMKMIGANNAIADVPNTLELKAAIQVGDDIGGYDVQLLGSIKRIDTNSVIRLSRYFKPVNFQVRVKQDGSYFIAGSNGMKMEELPVVNLNKPTNVGKNQVAGRKPTKGVVSKEGTALKQPKMEKLGSQIGLMDLYSAVEARNGYLVMLPDNTYEKTLKSDKQTGNDFIPYGIGELARLSGNSFTFNKNQLNASTTFKKPGIVRTTGGINVDCYTITNKKLVNNGKNHIKHIGVALTSDADMKAVMNLIGDPARCKVIEDTRTTALLRGVSGAADLKIFDCDISDVPIVLKERMPEHLMNTDELYKTVANLTAFEFANKYIKTGTGLCNELKKSLGREEAARISGKHIYSAYQGYPQELLQELFTLGIDIYTGAYTRTEKSKTVELEEKSGSGNTEPVVSIEYLIKGFDLAKWTYAKIKAEYELGDACKIPGRDIVKDVIEFNGSSGERYALALKKAEQIQSYVTALKKKIWLHKYCMYMMCDGKVHQQDKELWLPVPSRKKTVEVFECEKHQGFLLEISGTEI